LLEANSYQRVLERGFALVTDASGAAIKRSAEAPKGAEIAIQFVDGARHASLDSGDAPAKESKKDTAKKPRKKTRSPDQNELF
jgi:exodeoxyribonuclease VII large subunit